MNNFYCNDHNNKKSKTPDVTRFNILENQTNFKLV